MMHRHSWNIERVLTRSIRIEFHFRTDDVFIQELCVDVDSRRNKFCIAFAHWS